MGLNNLKNKMYEAVVKSVARIAPGFVNGKIQTDALHLYKELLEAQYYLSGPFDMLAKISSNENRRESYICSTIQEIRKIADLCRRDALVAAELGDEKSSEVLLEISKKIALLIGILHDKKFTEIRAVQDEIEGAIKNVSKMLIWGKTL